MERTKTTTEDDGRIWFQKLPGAKGIFILNNRHIKPGERFRAFPYEIPRSAANVIVPLEPIENVDGIITKAGTPPVKPVKIEYSLKEQAPTKEGEPSLWFVVAANGKVVNPRKPLSKEEAEKLIRDLLK